MIQQTPQAYGTGTEEWGGGGDYWGGRNMTLPFAGHPCGAKTEKEAKNDEDKIESAYRFLLADLMPFGKNAVIRLEHGGENESTEHYQTVTYWYGLPAASLVKTDELQIGDAESEKEHAYVSQRCFRALRNHFALRMGTGLVARERDLSTADRQRPQDARALRNSSCNWIPRTSASCFGANSIINSPINAPKSSSPTPKLVRRNGKRRGPGISRAATRASIPIRRPELGATEHNVQTSNRRFRDDEFLIPRKLTEGKKAIRVKVQFTPVNRPLFPGQPVPELAWSEIRYDAYCFVMPNFKAPR